MLENCSWDLSMDFTALKVRSNEKKTCQRYSTILSWFKEKHEWRSHPRGRKKDHTFWSQTDIVQEVFSCLRKNSCYKKSIYRNAINNGLGWQTQNNWNILFVYTIYSFSFSSTHFSFQTVTTYFSWKSTLFKKCPMQACINSTNFNNIGQQDIQRTRIAGVCILYPSFKLEIGRQVESLAWTYPWIENIWTSEQIRYNTTWLRKSQDDSRSMDNLEETWKNTFVKSRRHSERIQFHPIPISCD